LQVIGKKKKDFPSISDQLRKSQIQRNKDFLKFSNLQIEKDGFKNHDAMGVLGLTRHCACSSSHSALCTSKDSS
jgi:hypothetical protein